MKQIQWSDASLRDMAALRLRVGDFRVRFELDTGTLRILRVRNRRESYR